MIGKEKFAGKIVRVDGRGFEVEATFEAAVNEFGEIIWPSEPSRGISTFKMSKWFKNEAGEWEENPVFVGQKVTGEAVTAVPGGTKFFIDWE